MSSLVDQLRSRLERQRKAVEDTETQLRRAEKMDELERNGQLRLDSPAKK